jgi:hypothetical protein
MKILNYSVLLVSIVLLSSLVGCIDNNESSSKTPYLTHFSFSDQNGLIGISDIEFSIENPLPGQVGLITNSTPFPYGATLKKLVPRFTISDGSTMSYTIIDDSIGYITNNTAIDFSSPLSVVVYSTDRKKTTFYQIRVETDLLNPLTVNWTEKSTSLNTDVNLKPYFRSFYLGGKIFIVTGEAGATVNESRLYQSADGSSWSPVAGSNFPAGIYHTIQTFNDKAYIIGYVAWDETAGKYVQKNEIWESSNGIAWVKSDYPSGMTSVFKNSTVFKNRLWVWGGSSINADATQWQKVPYGANGAVLPGDRSIYSFDGNTWRNDGAIPSAMPYRFSSACTYNSRLQVYGGESESGATDDMWTLTDEYLWYEFPKTNAGVLEDSRLISYNNQLWLFGGKVNGFTIYTISLSNNDGKDFYTISGVNNGVQSPPFKYLQRAGQEVLLTPSNEIFVVGGYNISFKDSIADTTYLFDVWHAKMAKDN